MNYPHSQPVTFHFMTKRDDSSPQSTPPQKASDNASSPPRTVFVVSPIGKSGSPEHRRARLVLDYIIKKAFQEPHWKVFRADEENSPDSITAQVIDRIVKSDLIVADLSGHNPNVFYEIAVAHGYQRPVIHMITDGESVPFDIIDQRAIFYDLADPASVDAAISKMIKFQIWLEESPDALRNPLTTQGAFTAISSTPPGTESNEAIAHALNQIVARLSRLEQASNQQQLRVGGVTVKGVNPPETSWRKLEEEESEIIERIVQIDEEMSALSGLEGQDETLRLLGRDRSRLLRRLSRLSSNT